MVKYLYICAVLQCNRPAIVYYAIFNQKATRKKERKKLTKMYSVLITSSFNKPLQLDTKKLQNTLCSVAFDFYLICLF